MKQGSFISIWFFIFQLLFALIPALRANPQEPATEQHLENLADAEEDDSYMQLWEQLRKNPLDLNTVEENDLKELKILTALQVDNFIMYRKLFGKFISIYELQAIPAWDIITIKKLLPFITINDTPAMKEEFSRRLKRGDHQILLRIAGALEKDNGTKDTGFGKKWLGNPLKIFFRYRYDYKNLMQFGITGDKDAGEQFFKGAQRSGFDFYSFHIFARKLGLIQSLALGDFTVNMGQGLIHWQTLAFGKTADVMNIKHQSAVLRPYHSAGEINFHRGIGLTVKQGKIEATAFASLRRHSANIIRDTAQHLEFITSFLNSGYHRSGSEIADRNKLRVFSAGGNLKYKKNYLQVGLNVIHHRFSIPVKKRNEPYNLFEAEGDSWSNLSMDYNYTSRNFHVFGEAAIDKNLRKAFLNGLMFSVDPRADVSLLHRAIEAEYRSIYGKAFTENTQAANEQGLFTGLTIRPLETWRMDAYFDIFKSPWLRYGVDAPARGNDMLIQIIIKPNKRVEWYTRFRQDTKQLNRAGNSSATNQLVSVTRSSWRSEFRFKLNSSVVIRQRVEMLWYNKKSDDAEEGFLGFFDLFYNPAFKPYSGNLRVQYFECEGYSSRIYAYENDVLYFFSIPSFSEKGFRYYINIRYDFSDKVGLWIKWSQSLFQEEKKAGVSPVSPFISRSSEVKILARMSF